MANRYDIIRIDFQASAKGANTAIESIRQEAEQCNNKISELKKNIAEAPKNGTDAKILEGWNAELKLTERRFKQFNTAYKELVKGMRALDEGVKMFNDGSLSQMNAAFQKTVNNAAKLAQSKLQTGSNEWRQMGALMQETEQNYARMQRDTDQLIESLKNGGTVFRKTLDDEIKGLQDLMRILPYMGTEYRKAEEQMKFLVKTSDELIIKERQMQGEIVTTNDARRVSYQLTKEGAEAARQRAAAADDEIEKGKQIIANLEAEQKTREDNARVSAQAAAEYRQNQKMHEDEIERLDAEMKKEMELANSKKNGVEALKQKALGLQDEAETEKKKQQELDGVRDTAREKVEKLRQEYEALKQSVGSAPAKDPVSEAVKAGAEEVVEVVKKEAEETKKKATAKKEENQAAKETTETKKEEIKVEEKVVETQKDENNTVELLIAANDKIREKIKELTAEREKLAAAQKEGALATKEETNAFANLSKEQAEAMLKQKQALSTFKAEGGKMTVTNREEAQQYLFDVIGEIEPSNVGKTNLSIQNGKEKIGQLLGKFRERYGLKDDNESMDAIRELMSGGGLIKSGFMNPQFLNLDQNTAKIDAFNKSIKDLTAVINGETKAVEENVEKKKTLEEIDAEIDLLSRQSTELSKQTARIRNGISDSTTKEVKANSKLAESHSQNAEAIKKEIEAIKQLSHEQLTSLKNEMTAKSTVGWKANKLDASNLEQVQHWIVAQAQKVGNMDENGVLTVKGKNIDKLMTKFHEAYGEKGEPGISNDLFKEIIKGKGGGLFEKGGSLKGETLEINVNNEAYDARIQKLRAIFDITNEIASASNKSSKATKGHTDAIAEQEKKVKDLKDKWDEAKAKYTEYNNEYKKKASEAKKLSRGSMDEQVAAVELENEAETLKTDKVDRYASLRDQYKQAYTIESNRLKKMQSQDTEETQKNTDAQNQNTEATENNTKSKGRKKKAAEETAKATVEETQKSAELLAKEKELSDAEKELETAQKNAENQQRKTTKAVEEAEAAVTKADDADKKHVETMDKLADEQQQHKKDLQELNEANKDTIATNEQNQKLLAETNNKILEQGEKIRDAERIKAQAKTDGIEKTEQAIRLLTEENRHIDQNSFTWKRNTIEIQHLQEALDEMKNKPVLMMMEQRMKNVGALSASAVTETKRFWEAMVAGAEKGSEKLATAEAYLKTITEEEQKRDEAQAGKVIGNMGNYSDKEIADAVKTFEQLRDAQTHGNEEWINFNNLVQQGKQHLEELAKQDALTKMEANMSNLATLSDAARNETKKFFEAMKAGAEQGSEELEKAKDNLKLIKNLEDERAKTENERKAQIVSSGGSLNMYSEADITDAIKAAKELHSHMASASPEAQKLADSIANAEAHVKQYGIEAARTAQRQKEMDAIMEEQYQSMARGMMDKIMPSQTAIKNQLNYWQRLIDDPKTASASLLTYRDNLAKVQKMYDAMVEINGKTAFEWFRSGMDKDASDDKIKDMAGKLKEYRGTLLHETNAEEIQKIDEYLQRVGASAKKAGEELMDFEKAKELALQAGDDVYGKNNPAFLASPEEIKAAAKSIENYRENLFKTIKAKKDMGEATDEEEAELKELAKYLKDLKFEQDNFNMSREKMEQLMDTPVNATSIDELREAIKRADAELKRMEGSLGKNNKEYQAFADKVRNAKNTLKEMEGAAKASATAWEKAWSRLKTYVVMYMGFNAAWQKMMGTAEDLMQLSDKMGEVRKTTGFTADEVGRLSDNLAKLDTRTSLTGLMEFSSLAGSIGMKTQEDVQGFTEAANMLAVSLPEMGNEASRTLMKIADATGDLEKNGGNVRETLERVGSTIIALRANSAAAAGPITDFVSRVGAVGAQAGISIDQIAALGATVDALGGRVEMSATALSRMIPAIKNNTFEVAKAIGMTEKELKNMSGMDQMVAIFRKLHDSAKGFDTSTEEGMNAMADSVEKALGRSTSMQEVMKELNQQGARAGIVFGLLSQNVDKLEEQLDTASQAYQKNIALMDEYNKMNDTTAARWERLKNQLEEAFVSDYMQRLLGTLIETLRYLVDFITGNVTGVFKALNTALFTLAAGFVAFKSGIGAALVSLGGLSKALSNFRAAITLAIGDMGRYIQQLWLSKFALDEEARAAARAKLATMGATKAMMANVVMAFVAAIAMLAWKLYETAQAAKEAAAEQGRFNQQVADEKKALDGLFEPLNKSNLAQEERAKLIKEINSQYGKYLGYMLSETSTAIQLADAHALIAKRIREEAYERRIAEKEKEIQGKHDEDVNAAYTKITERVRGSERGGASAQEIADVLKGIVDNRIGEVRYAIDNANDIFATKYSYNLDPKIKAAIDGGIERLIADGKLSRDNSKLIRNAVYHYTVEAHEQHKDIMDQTANLRSDLRGIQGAIKVDLANNLNTLISNVANSVGNAVKQVQNKQQPQQQSPYLQSPGSHTSRIPSLFGGGQQGGTSWQAPWKQNSRETTPEQQMAPAGWKPKINKKNVEEVRQFVQDQEALRGALEAGGQQIDEAQRRVAESWLLTDKELKEYKAIVEKADRGPGGSNYNPYGDYNKVTSPYSQWNGDDLVARRKEMLDRVRALANGADVQKVLSEDAKFISDAVRKNIKTTEQAIEWYNTERLKIQDALHAKHLTNTGDWLDPKKGGKKASKMVQDEMKYYLDELDAYYTERKAKIQEDRNDEAISEAEAWNRDIKNEAEWYRRRAELQQLYAKEGEKVTKDELDAIFSILSERTDDSVDYIKKDIDHTVKFIEKVGKEKGKPAMDRIIGDIDLGIEKAFLKQRNTLGKHLKAIEDIVNKERPFSGIAKNMQDNLGKMGILTADMEEGADSAAEELKRITFLLGESENAYTMTVEKLLDDMRQNGFKEWADVVSKDPSMQQGLLAMLRQTFDAVQDAIKKESSIIKKQVEIMMQDITDQVQADTTHLQILQNSVERANSLIGAGTASARVADKLAMKQMQLQITMQETRIRMLKKAGADRVALLQQEADLLDKQGKKEEAKQKRMDAENVEKSVGLTLTKEQVELDKQRISLAEKLEESQNRLYTNLKEWGDLLYSSMKDIFEASHAGDAEYYNERAKMNLTGKGGPGAGTYIVIDNEGTEDATAHYEYLDERQALERQREIERENAQAEAWKKMWDDINMKLSETITDQLNAMLQNQAINTNTSAVNANTAALNKLAEVTAENAEVTAKNAETTVKASTTPAAPVAPQVIIATGDKKDKKHGTATFEPLESPEWLKDGNTPDGTTGNPLAVKVVNEDGKPTVKSDTGGSKSESRIDYANASMGEPNVAGESRADYANELMFPSTPSVPSESRIDYANSFMGGEISPAAQQQIDDSNAVKDVKVNNKKEEVSTEIAGDKKMVASNASTISKMIAATNLYGAAYQAMSNENLDAAQKFEMIALQAVGNAAIAGLQVALSSSTAQTAANMPAAASKASAEEGPIAGPILFAILSALVGGLMGLAVSKVAKSKSTIAQVTGASVNAGRLATGMMTYAEGNVNEFTDPGSLKEGRQYNVDGADGRTYRARYMGKGAKTHITNGPEFHLVGEKGREAIIDAHTTRNIQLNEPEIWRSIQTLYNGGSLRHSTRRGHGMAAYAEGNLDEFEMSDAGGMMAEGGFSPEMMTQMQAALDRNSAVMETIVRKGIKAYFDVYGKGGLVDSYDTGKKTVKRHGERY